MSKAITSFLAALVLLAFLTGCSVSSSGDNNAVPPSANNTSNINASTPDNKDCGDDNTHENLSSIQDSPDSSAPSLDASMDLDKAESLTSDYQKTGFEPAMYDRTNEETYLAVYREFLLDYNCDDNDFPIFVYYLEYADFDEIPELVILHHSGGSLGAYFTQYQFDNKTDNIIPVLNKDGVHERHPAYSLLDIEVSFPLYSAFSDIDWEANDNKQISQEQIDELFYKWLHYINNQA